MEMGLKYVYEGNIFSDGANTICPGCKKTIARRSWHDVAQLHINEDGACQFCGYKVPGHFKKPVMPSRSATHALRERVELLQGSDRVV
jgi:ribosomal protein L37AE/L43A